MKATLVRRTARRGAVSMMTLSFALALEAAPAAAPNGSPSTPRPAVMDKFNVNNRHLLCFGLAIELWEDKTNQRVMAMYVKEVQEGSMAEEKGLVAGTRIFGINGIPAESFDATFKEGSELNRIFVNRKDGDQVTLEIKQPGRRGTEFVTLVEHRARLTTPRP